MCAAAVTYQEHPIRVIARQGLARAAAGARPGEEESEQFEDVLRVCRVLQFVVWRSQSVVRHDHWGRRGRSKAAREDCVVLLIFAF